MPCASHVTVGVLLSAAEILDGDVLDEHLVLGVAIEDGLSAGPLAGSSGSWVRGIKTADPAAHLDLHWGLGVAGSRVGSRVVGGEGADGGAVDVPDYAVGGPDDGVVVESVDGGCDLAGSSTIIGGGITLAEEVGLDIGVVRA